MRILGFLIAFTLFAVSVEAKDLYVDGSTGNDSTTYAANDSNNPWRTIGRASWGSTNRNSPNRNQAAQAGDTVYIAAGTYHDNSGFSANEPLYNPINSGNSGNYITFQAVGTVTLTSGPITPQWGDGAPLIGGGFNTQYIKWDGFTINQANVTYRQGNGIINIWNNYITISNCDIAGIHTTFQAGNNHNAMYIHGGSGSNLRGILIENNRLHGFVGDSGRNDSAITLYYINDIIIRNNEFYDNQTGIYAKTTSGDSNLVQINNNLFYDNSGDCLALQSLYNVRFYQNVLRDSQIGFYFFPQTYQSGTIKPAYYYIVNNTFDDMSIAAVRVNGYLSSLINNSYVWNNIVTNSTNAIRCDACPTPSDMQKDDIDFDYNFYGFTSNFAWSDSGRTWSFATWRGTTFSQDINSTTGTNPSYVNQSGDDFRLASGSPCREGQAYDGVDILDLDNDGSTTDPITLGAYITGNERIGRADLMPPSNLRIVSQN